MINSSSSLFAVLLVSSILNFSVNGFCCNYEQDFPPLSASSSKQKVPRVITPTSDIKAIPQSLNDFKHFWSEVKKFTEIQRNNSNPFITRFHPQIIDKICHRDIKALWMGDIVIDEYNLLITYDFLTHLRHEPFFYNATLMLFKEFSIATRTIALESKISRAIAKIYSRKYGLNKSNDEDYLGWSIDWTKRAIHQNKDDYENYLWYANLLMLECENSLSNLQKVKKLLEKAKEYLKKDILRYKNTTLTKQQEMDLRKISDGLLFINNALLGR
jgi:hypothetical protein